MSDGASVRGTGATLRATERGWAAEAAERSYLAFSLMRFHALAFLTPAFVAGWVCAFALGWWGVDSPSWIALLHVEDWVSLEAEPLIHEPLLPALVQWWMPLLLLAIVEPLVAWSIVVSIEPPPRWAESRSVVPLLSLRALPVLGRMLSITLPPVLCVGVLLLLAGRQADARTEVIGVLLPMIVCLLRVPSAAALPLLVLERRRLREALRLSLLSFARNPAAAVGAGIVLVGLALLVQGMLRAPLAFAGCRECGDPAAMDGPRSAPRIEASLGTQGPEARPRTGSRRSGAGSGLTGDRPDSILCHGWWRPCFAWCAILPFLPLHALGYMEIIGARPGRWVS